MWTDTFRQDSKVVALGSPPWLDAHCLFSRFTGSILRFARSRSHQKHTSIICFSLLLRQHTCVFQGAFSRGSCFRIPLLRVVQPDAGDRGYLCSRPQEFPPSVGLQGSQPAGRRLGRGPSIPFSWERKGPVKLRQLGLFTETISHRNWDPSQHTPLFPGSWLSEPESAHPGPPVGFGWPAQRPCTTIRQMKCYGST